MNSVLLPQNGSYGQHTRVPKIIWQNYITNNGVYNKKFIFPILLLLVVVVVVVVQFQTLYLKNRKLYKSETLHTGRVP